LSTYNDNTNEHNSKIMVLDDDFDIATLAKMTLQRNGFKNVFAFTDAGLALEHFRLNHQTYSLVISDIRMPNMNGYEFIKNICTIKPEINVLLMTAFDVNEDLLIMKKMYSINVRGIIQKPVSPKKLAKIVATTDASKCLDSPDFLH
jgi:DNA-binding NtrC family response regulator